MKKISLITIFLICSLQGFSNSFSSLWVGAGIATHNNYDVGTNLGISYIRAFSYRFGVGFHAFAQQYNLYFDNQNGMVQGASIRHNSNFAFFCPTFDYHLGKKGNVHVYINGGVGMKGSVVDTMHKWSRPNSAAAVGYDSLIDLSSNINSMVMRIGFGMTEYFSLGRHWSLTMTEDFGFLPTKLSEAGDASNRNLEANLSRLYRPTYITFRLGICYLR